MTSDDRKPPRPPRIERLDDPEALKARLRGAARGLAPDRVMDDLEVAHLIRVVTECSMLLSDVYSEERLARIMHPERGFLRSLVDRLVDRERRGEGEVLYRVRRLPDDVRVIGDKALFDLGLSGRHRVKGYDLEELGARAYRMAGELLELLAEDQRLRRFFKENRLLVLPLEEEVVFLRQCSDQFGFYADILRRVYDARGEDGAAGDPGSVAPTGEELAEVARRVPLMAAAAQALRALPAAPDADAVPGPAPGEPDPYVVAAQGGGRPEAELSHDHQISAYERMLLFSGIDLDRLVGALDRTVIDQEAAVRALCDEFSLFAAGTRDPRKPPAYFLVGPTGVGKNHLVESLCRTLEALWQVPVPLLTIEGPSYTYPSDINELRGATRGFIRSDEEGLLTSFHNRSSKAPFGVILVDEVEKAHPQLLTFFLGILDRGTTTDNRGDVLNFANCMVFFTSNLGYSDAQQFSSPVGFVDGAEKERKAETDVRRELRRALKPEFVNRVRMIHFDRLTERSAGRILDLGFERIARRYREVHGVDVALDPSARDELIRRGFSPAYGARHLGAVLESVCNVEIAKKVRSDDAGLGRDRAQLLAWLREMREGKRPFSPDEVRGRVLELARASLGYDRVVVRWDGESFAYDTEAETGTGTGFGTETETETEGGG